MKERLNISKIKLIVTVLGMAIVELFAFDSKAERLSFPGVEAATVGLGVFDIEKNEYVVAENLDKAMIPASTAKCVTVATSLYNLSSGYVYETPVFIEGDIQKGKLFGNIVVEGVGDPTINSKHFLENPDLLIEIADALCEKGIKEISGRIIVNSGFIPYLGANEQWTVGDVGEDYGAGCFRFNYADNVFDVDLNDFETMPLQPYAEFVVDDESKQFSYCHGIGSDRYYIFGQKAHRQSLNLPMNSPSASFVEMLTKELNKREITVGNEGGYSTENRKQLLIHRSASLKEIAKSLMHRSDNMMAEAILRSQSADFRLDEALALEYETLQRMGISTDYLRLVDGSGLARCDRLTPRLLTELLSKMACSVCADDYLECFPVVGQEGTVKNLLKGKPIKGKLRLKSGSLNGVHCYAGYKEDESGKPTHVVVIIVNNFFCKRSEVRNAIERWLANQFFY